MRGTRISVRLLVLTLSLVSLLRAESPSPVTPVEIHAPRAMVIGFLGGFVKHNASAHSTVQVVEHLRRPDGTRDALAAFLLEDEVGRRPFKDTG